MHKAVKALEVDFNSLPAWKELLNIAQNFLLHGHLSELKAAFPAWQSGRKIKRGIKFFRINVIKNIK